MIKVESRNWTGMEDIDSEALLRDIRTEARIVTKEALLLFEREVKLTLSGQRSGQTYKVGERGLGSGQRQHVASAPGEPPAVLFGNLRGSVGHEGPHRRSWGYEGEVGPGLGQDVTADERDAANSYARRLELGGVDSRGVRILPRPYMEPSARRARPKVHGLWERRLGSSR